MKQKIKEELNDYLYELRQYDAETIVGLYHVAICIHTLVNDHVFSTIPCIFFNVLFLVSITKKSYLFKKFLAFINIICLSSIYFEYIFNHNGITDTNIQSIWISIVVMIYFIIKKRNGESRR